MDARLIGEDLGNITVGASLTRCTIFISNYKYPNYHNCGLMHCTYRVFSGRKKETSAMFRRGSAPIGHPAVEVNPNTRAAAEMHQSLLF